MMLCAMLTSSPESHFRTRTNNPPSPIALTSEGSHIVPWSKKGVVPTLNTTWYNAQYTPLRIAVQHHRKAYYQPKRVQSLGYRTESRSSCVLSQVISGKNRREHGDDLYVDDLHIYFEMARIVAAMFNVEKFARKSFSQGQKTLLRQKALTLFHDGRRSGWCQLSTLQCSIYNV